MLLINSFFLISFVSPRKSRSTNKLNVKEEIKRIEDYARFSHDVRSERAVKSVKEKKEREGKEGEKKD